jgi:predicted ATPase
MNFNQLQLSGWRQFRSVDLSLHDRLTILTGANGAGKTTILNMLARHFGWQANLVGTPRSRRVAGQPLSYRADLWSQEFLSRDSLFDGKLAENFDDLEDEQFSDNTEPQRDIGAIRYGDGQTGRITAPAETGSTYSVKIHNQQVVKGLHIPSHRPIYSYQPVQSIPTVPRKREETFNLYCEIVRQRWSGGHHQWTPNYFIKEALIAMATFGHGNEVVEPNAELLHTFKNFERILSLVLPPKIGFQKILIRIPEVVLATKSGHFSLDAASGGLASIIDIAWQIFMYSPAEEPFVVTMDEPENHLHPELQRTLLPSLIEAFPLVQFIVASHNPFIVGSVPDSNVYVLNYDSVPRVYSFLLDTVNRAGSSNEILRDVLGLDFTIPLWVEKQLDQFVAEFEDQELTSESLRTLRERLKTVGMEKYVPDTIARIAEQRLKND